MRQGRTVCRQVAHHLSLALGQVTDQQRNQIVELTNLGSTKVKNCWLYKTYLFLVILLDCRLESFLQPSEGLVHLSGPPDLGAGQRDLVTSALLDGQCGEHLGREGEQPLLPGQSAVGPVALGKLRSQRLSHSRHQLVQPGLDLIIMSSCILYLVCPFPVTNIQY